jgi:methylmalonyl-CoA mutase, C-terminal domain
VDWNLSREEPASDGLASKGFEGLRVASETEMAKKTAAIQKKIRILVAKPGLDGHDRGVLVLARAFRDAGMEVIYSGLLPSPEQVAQMAVDEDVDVVALSLLNGAHMTAFPKVKKLLDRMGGRGIVVVGGGIIPEEDKPKLLKLGITGLYGPGSSFEEIVRHVKERVRKERWGE